MSWLDRLSAAALALSGGTLLLNLLVFREPDGALPEPAPAVSVLVPARNEERSIERCVRSLLAQAYPHFEIIVLDDHSEDATGEILRRLTLERGRAPLRVLRGEALPPGWVGKNWACHQLARAANPRSRWLLFTDADTWHAPDALRRTVAEAEREGLALLSLMPEQETGTWAERAAVPLLPLQILGLLPLPAMERLSSPAIAAANGQFMLFRRDRYDAIGGHGARPNQIAEDVTLARLVKAHGGRVRLASGAGLVRCRMYDSAGDVIAGFRRSFASGFRIDGRVAGSIAALNALAYAWPLARAASSRRARRLALVVLGLRAVLAWRTRAPLRSVALHPLGIALMLWAQALAAYDAFVGEETAWKGRRYGLGNGQGHRKKVRRRRHP